MKMSKRIVSLIVTVIMLMSVTALFPSADGASIKLVNWNRNDYFSYEWTGGGADSWVGIYHADETPSAELLPLLGKVTDGQASGTDAMSNQGIYTRQNEKGTDVRFGESFTVFAPGDYKICLFKDAGYEVIASETFTVKEYDVLADNTSTYVSDLQWLSWIVYKQTSEDVKSDANPDGLELEKMSNKPYYNRSVGGFDEATGAFDYGDGASATTNLIINVAGVNYEKGVSLALDKAANHTKEFAGRTEAYCEVTFDITGLDVNTFSCVFGKNTPGQQAWEIGGCEIVVNDGTKDTVVYTYSEKMGAKDSIDVKCNIPEGQKTLTLRAYSWNQQHQSGGVNFADAKLYKGEVISTGTTDAPDTSVADTSTSDNDTTGNDTVADTTAGTTADTDNDNEGLSTGAVIGIVVAVVVVVAVVIVVVIKKKK